MEKAFRVIRVITVPPVFALALLLTVYFRQPGVFASAWQLVCAILFLSALPVLGYPLQRYIPYFRDKGREGQRSLAMICSASGYLLGFVTTLMTQASHALAAIYLEYLLCGIAMLVFNRCFHLRASGHACGIVAPVLLLAAFRLYAAAFLGALLIIPVLLSSVRTGRHSAPQLLGGCLIAAVCMALTGAFVLLL